MEDTNRMAHAPVYPKMIYFESLFLFMGGNFIYHQRIFRQKQSRFLFSMFMAVNAWTSFQVAECMNSFALDHYAAGLNNHRELEHRQLVTETYRKAVLRKAIQQ